MPGPWEQYAAPAEGAKPWEKYGPAGGAGGEKPMPTGKPLGNTAATIGEPLLQMASGMIAKPVSDIAGLAATAKEMIAPGDNPDAPAGFKRHVQDSMTYQPRTQLGELASEYNPLSLIGKGVSKVADWAGSSVGGNAPGDSPRGMAGNALREGIEQAPGFIGGKLGRSAEIAMPPKQAALDAAKARNVVADSTRDTAQQAGYITPPETGIKAAATGLAGKAKTEKVISEKNAQNATNRLAKEVGAPDGAALSKDVIENLKQEAYGHYDAMTAAAGPRLKPSREFRAVFNDTIAKLDADISLNKVANKDLIPARDLLKSIADQPNFPTENTLRMIKRQRAAAKTDFRNGDAEMGTARLAVSEQLENLFEKNLAETGQQGLVKAFQDSRVNLAKLHLLDRVVNEGTGKVDLSKLASLSDTKAYKGVLTGEFKTAADFAKAYRKAAQKSTGEAAPRLTVFDGMFGLGALAAGHPLLAAGELGGRVAVPAMAERGMLQNRTPSYEIGPGGRALPNLLRAGGVGAGEQAQQIPPPP